MKIILTKSIPSVGKTGQVVEVADAYARNFLLPKKLAIVASPQHLAAAAARQRAEERAEKTLQAEREKVLATINESVVEIRRPGVAQQRLYAAIHASDILSALREAFGNGVSGARIVPDTIKEPGDHKVTVSWADQKSVVCTLRIVATESHGTPTRR